MGKLVGLDRISEFSKKFSAISTYLGYKKFENDKPRVLVFNSQGWCCPDVIYTLKKMNYPVLLLDTKHLDPGNKSLTLEDYLKFHKVLIQSLIEFKPDCILTLNHAAFDSLGLLTKILDQFSIPFISWFVDSPLYIFKNPVSQLSKNLFLFCWEKTYIKRLEDLGFSNVFFIPLGASPDFFSEPAISQEDENIYSCDVAFVGNSNKEGTEKYLLKEFLSEPFSLISEKAINMQLENPEKPMNLIFNEIDIEKNLEKFEIDIRLTFESYCVLESTSRKRIETVRTLSNNFNFKIFGDEGWKDEFPDHYVKSLDYYRELSKVYKLAKVVVNLTSFQMNTAINQRIFDAPLTGGFIISDYKKDYDELFGKDVVPTFRKEDEMISKINYYLENETERLAKTAEIKKIILEKHSYEYRIKELFSMVKEKFEKNA
jgi:spore maturation protein CgeB